MNSRSQASSTAKLTIDLGALAANWRKLAGLAPKSRTGAAVKADAYGLGAPAIVEALARAGCREFFVANAGEGVLARKAASEAGIFVLGGVSGEGSLDACATHRLVPVLNHPGEIEIWRDHCRSVGRALPCALHFDTGMNRLGIETGDLERVCRLAAGLEINLVMSHLACADEPGHPANGAQLQRFRAILERFPGVAASLCNSAGVQLGPDWHFDLTRPGIALYGGESVNDIDNIAQPVAALEAKILQVRTARKDETVGYGATARLARDSRLAVLGIGYADGFSRAASGSGVPLRSQLPGPRGWLEGYSVPVVGRVSMDLTVFDVTDVPDQVLERAEWVELFGSNVALDDFARAAGTIGYEVLTGMGPRVARVYVDG